MIADEKFLDNRADKDSDNKQNVNKETVFYAVYVPGEADKDLQAKHVYLEKNEALRAVKEHQGSRFKCCKKRADAEQFALKGYERSVPSSPAQTGVYGEEKVNNFKAPKPQELVAFRRLIESGNLEEVERIIWENPRYIISSCDTPTILQEGSRYNVLHIAVRSPDPAKVCELLLNTVTNREFLKLFYGELKNESYLDYSQLLVDRFINTPDKGLNETSLHFASKFGHKNMVQVLVSYPQCVKTVLNKFSQSPKDLICSRKPSCSEKLKMEISSLLDEQYYVPVLRSIDNTVQPIIGEPFSPAKPPKLNIDPFSPPTEISAFAGPMPKEKAEEFRKKWKTPPRRNNLPSPNLRSPNFLSPNGRENIMDTSLSTVHSPVLNLASRLQDPEKGLERVGRELAEECKVHWKEFWRFLNDYADLRDKDDLMKLEAYLKSKIPQIPPVYCTGDEIENKNAINKENVKDDSMKDTKNDVKNSTLDEINNLCEKFQATKLDDEDSDDDQDISESEFVTPPTSPMLTDDSSSDEDDMCMAPEAKSTFIEGDQATKLDYAVYNAIPHDLDQYEFPYIYYWKHEMELLMQQNYKFVGKTPARTKMTLAPERAERLFSNLKPLRIKFD